MAIGGGLEVVAYARHCLDETIGRVPTPTTIRRVPAKLKPSQRVAAALPQIGEGSFDNHGRGLVEPSGSTIQFIRVLDRHPEFVEDVR
ncbi:type II toxin-antitoxin system MqsA family antitoxin [Methylobacterium iners]|uniref:Uncharacterized protein n=1 Tax=Methylobacterium iners TaxID=418707 RepID=A0ABQ4RV32_9HYPH|nr:type II toxin-antitoxin system MqsA family antitoxin [Methylobacterium iners]GJD94436.1 hypothetical protein OCOJLMKI_1638 [Methylobacterium iners]